MLLGQTQHMVVFKAKVKLYKVKNKVKFSKL